jgi:hypothetical protein
LAEMAHSRHTKLTPAIRLGIGEYQSPQERLHALRNEFLRVGAHLHPEMLDQVSLAADTYRQLYEDWRRLQMDIHPRFRPAPRWPAIGAVILNPSVDANCPEQRRDLRQALNTWARACARKKSRRR